MSTDDAPGPGRNTTGKEHNVADPSEAAPSDTSTKQADERERRQTSDHQDTLDSAPQSSEKAKMGPERARRSRKAEADVGAVLSRLGGFERKLEDIAAAVLKLDNSFRETALDSLTSLPDDEGDAQFSAQESSPVLLNELEDMKALRQEDMNEIRRLRDENHVLRQGFVAQSLKPVIAHMFNTYDEVCALIESEPGAAYLENVKRSLSQGIQTGFDATPFIPQRGEMVDPKRHEAIAHVPRDQPDVVPNSIESMQQVGFENSTGAILRKAKVKVFR